MPAFADLVLKHMDVSRCCQGHGLPQAATIPRRPRRPWHGSLSRALPISDGRADRTSGASTGGSEKDSQSAQTGAEKPAAPWPRVIADIRDNSYESQSEPEKFSWFDEELSQPDAAKAREAFLLRLVTLGFGAVLVGERLTGRGVVQALGHPTGIPLAEMDVALGLLAGALLVGGLVPTNVVYESVNEKTPGIFDDIPALIGRASCVLLAGTIIAEVITGKGALALLNLETGTEYVSEIEGGLIFLVLLFVTNTRRKDS